MFRMQHCLLAERLFRQVTTVCPQASSGTPVFLIAVEV